MYGRTGNFSHFRGRTGSHSTKGSARGIVWIVPKDAGSVVEEAQAAPNPTDPRVEVSINRLGQEAHRARLRLREAHKRGDAKELARAKKHIAMVCGLKRGVKKYGARHE